MAARNEAKIRFSAETKEFDKGLKSANSTLSGLRSELRLNEAQMKANGTTIDGLRAKQQNLTAQMDAAQDKTKALSDKLEVAVAVFGENSIEANKLRTQLVNAQIAEAKLQDAINKCNAELEQQEQAAREAETASAKLSDEIGEQKTELDKLKKAYVDAVLEFGEGSDEANALAGKIDELSGELKTNKKRMDDASRAADELDRSLDDVSDSAEDAANDGFTVLKGAMADLVSEGIQTVMGGLGEMFSYFGELPQETAEIRQDMGTLVTAFDNVGMSTETATDTWKELYKVFGEDDRAVETANNIARIADNEKELNDWVNITTGIWGTYQDSLPVEGLAEAAAETAKTGTVTGGLADALNWSSEAATMFADYMGDDVVTAEDAFNKALAECTTEQERQALITDTLSTLYGGAADKYRDTTSAQMEAKEATAEQILAENNLASAIEPVTTAWQGLKNELLVGILPAVETVSGAMTSVLEWMKEHPTAVKAIAAAVGVLAIGLGALSIAVGIYTAAQWAMNSAILANPITWIVVGIVAAIAALVAIFVTLWNECEGFRDFFINMWEMIKNVWAECQPYFEAIGEAIKTAFSVVKDFLIAGFKVAWENIKLVWSVVVGYFKMIWNNIKLVFSAVKSVLSGDFRGAWEAIKGIWSNVSGYFGGVIDKVKSTFSKVKDIITKPFKTAIDKVKGFFDGLKLKFPNIKLPHFKIKGSFSLSPPSVPKLSIDWYKDGGIMMNPTIFGMNGNRLMAGGEAGPEAILPIDRLQGYISSAIDRTMQTNNLQALVNAVEDLASRAIELNINGRQFAVATAADTDNVSGNRYALTKRGLAL